MENEVIRLQLQEQLARLEGQLETCEKNIRDFTDKIEETENDMSKARDMHDRYMDRVAAMNSYNERLQSLSNLRCVKGLARRNAELINGSDLTRALGSIDEMLTECRRDRTSCSDRLEECRSERTSLQNMIEEVRRELYNVR